MKDEVGMMTTRATDKEKMGMMEARTVAKMRGQGEMPTIDAMDGDSQVRCNGDDPTNGVATHTVSTPATVQIVGRMAYHSRNFTLITEGDGTGQELECDFTLGTQQARMLVDDILDINAGEKALMTIWNEHLTTYVSLGQDFVESHFKAVPDLCLYGNFVCHVTTLQQAGLITHEAMWTSLPRWTASPRGGLTWTQ
jgi:hypothetical protein